MKLRGAWRVSALVLALTLAVAGGCGVLDALAGADEPDPAAVAALEDAKAKYEATAAELARLREQVNTDGVTPDVINRMAAQVQAVNEANQEVQKAMEVLRRQQEAGGPSVWLSLLQIMGAQLGIDLAFRGKPTGGVGGAVANLVTTRKRAGSG